MFFKTFENGVKGGERQIKMGMGGEGGARFFWKVGRKNFPKDNLRSRAPVSFSEINTRNIFQRCNENINLKC